MSKLIESIILLIEPPDDPFSGCSLRFTSNELSKACTSKYQETHIPINYISCANCTFHHTTYKLITLTLKENIQNV